MTKDELLICAQQCLKDKECCEAEKCRFNIDYEREFNCCLISVYLNGPLSLRQVAEREGISFARVKHSVIHNYLFQAYLRRIFKMARKTLLNESEIRRFMKLASIKPLKEGYGEMPGMRDKKEGEEEGEEKVPGMRNYKMQEQEEEEVDVMAPEEAPMPEPMDEPMPEPMDEPMDMDMGGAGASEQEEAMEEVIAAIVKFAEMSGGKVNVDVELEPEDGGKEEGGDAAGMKGGEPDKPVDAPEAGEEGEVEDDEEEGPVMEREEEIVAEVARRVAARLLKEKKTEAMANKLAESIFRRLASK
jgi:hypothetical protein